MYISIFFFWFFSTIVYYKILNIVPCYTGKKIFVVYFIFDSVHLLIPYSQFIPTSSSVSPSVSSVTQLCLTLCDPMDCSTPGFPVNHQFLEFTQTHVHRVSDTIQPSHPLSSPSPPSFLLLLFGNHRCFFYVCESFCFINKFFCTFFLDFVCKWYHMLFVFLCLT